MGRRRVYRRWTKDRVTERPVYGWYRPGTLTAGNYSGADDGVLLLGGASSLMPQPSTALDVGRGGRLVIERMIVRIIGIVVSTGITQLIKFVWGLRLDELDADGTLRATADAPKVLAGDTDSRREDWLWRAMGTVNVRDVVGQQYFLPEPVRDSWTFADFRPRRPFGDRMGIVFHWHSTLITSPGTNPDSVHTITVEPEILFRLPKSR